MARKSAKKLGIGAEVIGSVENAGVEVVTTTVEAKEAQEESTLVGRLLAGKKIVSDDAIEESNLRRIVDENEATFILSPEEIEAYVR